MKKILLFLFSKLFGFNSNGETICFEIDAKEIDGIFYLFFKV